MSSERELLRGNRLFQGIPDRVLEKFIDRAAGMTTLEKDEILFVEEDPDDREIYLVLEGEIRMEVELTSPEEQLEALVFPRGEIVGALAFLDVGMRLATAIANGPTKLLVWNKAEWKQICEDEPHIGYTLAVRIARELATAVRSWHVRLLNTVSWGLEG